MTSNIFVMRQPLTCQVLNLKQSTAEYLEQMRLHCKENEYNILDFFNEDKEEKFGCVPEYVFLYIIREKFCKQADFSMDQVRNISAYFSVPDGKIWYAMMHDLMNSEENVLDVVRKTALNIIEVPGGLIISSPTAVSNTAIRFPSAQDSTSSDDLSPPPSKFSLLHPQQQQPNPRFGNTSGQFGTCTATTMSNGSAFGSPFGPSSGRAGPTFGPFGGPIQNSGSIGPFGGPIQNSGSIGPANGSGSSFGPHPPSSGSANGRGFSF